YSGTIDEYDLWETSVSTQEVKTYNSMLHFDLNPVCPVDMQEYKLVIYHSDKAAGGSNFYKNNDCLKIFFQLGGNILASLGDNAYNVYNGCNNNAFDLLVSNFGIPIKVYSEDPEMVIKIAQSNITNPFMIGVTPVSPYTTQLDLELDSEIVWNSLVNMTQGLGPCSYFAEDLFEVYSENPFITPPTAIYRYISKPVGDTNFDPDQDEYDLYNNQVVAIKHTSENNTNYMFGFALPYMQADDLRAMFNKILSELGM
ncbi:MAG: hypothetical protein P9X26_08245, partial [Candidatus Stygibacter frigidus]|nr:hypothetical protein [Candidatus Stygibacter frigidus]